MMPPGPDSKSDPAHDLAQRVLTTASSHRYEVHEYGDGWTEPREETVACSCGTELTFWQQGYVEEARDPRAEYAAHLVRATLGGEA